MPFIGDVPFHNPPKCPKHLKVIILKTFKFKNTILEIAFWDTPI